MDRKLRTILDTLIATTGETCDFSKKEFRAGFIQAIMIIEDTASATPDPTPDQTGPPKVLSDIIDKLRIKAENDDEPPYKAGYMAALDDVENVTHRGVTFGPKHNLMKVLFECLPDNITPPQIEQIKDAITRITTRAAWGD